jgi:tRNA/rRNA methyltransferase
MCARALANMGLERLILINPQCDPFSEEGRQGAANAQSVLRQAIIYDSQQHFLEQEGDGLRIALSGRDGRLRLPDELGPTLTKITADPTHRVHDAKVPIHLLFGPEDDGLANEEMELAHYICRLPTFGEVTSLNLSHAVLLTAYMVRSALLGAKPQGSTESPRIERRPAYYPSESIHRWLEALGFDLSAPRVNIEKTLNRIFLSHCSDETELRILDSVLHQTIRKLNDRDTGSSK